MADRLSALIVCPGRGTYGKNELGYLKRHHSDKKALIERFDQLRADKGQETLSELDGADRYRVPLHSRGDIASPLIFACSFADFLSIDRDRFDIAAVTGNSMGWYTSLACAGAVTAEDGFRIVNAMGENSQSGEAGGQILLTLVDDDWKPVPGLRDAVLERVADIESRPGCALYVSIELGGMIVLAGNYQGLDALLAEAPATPGREPLRLVNHGPFHTSLMKTSSQRAFQLPESWINAPERPMIDGRGAIWRPHATSPDRLRHYTFATQILETYSFTRAIQVSVKEYAPDRIILLGPGDTLGGAIAQSLIEIEWLGIRSKKDFQEVQQSAPCLLSMGREDQRALVVR